MLLRFKQFIEAWENDSTLQYRSAIDKGRAREGKIIEALKSKYKIERTSEKQDMAGIDCYITANGRIWSTQIKTAQGGDNVRFQIKKGGQASKEMNPTAELYAYYITRTNMIHFISTKDIQKVLTELNNLLNTTYKNKWDQGSEITIPYKGVNAYITTSADRLTTTQTNIEAYLPLHFITDFIKPVLPPFHYQN